MIYRFKHRDRVPGLTDGLLASYADTPKGMDQLEVEELPSRSEMVSVTHDLLTVLFPGYFGPSRPTRETLGYFVGSHLSGIYERLTLQIFLGLRHRCTMEHASCPNCRETAEDIALKFLEGLPAVRKMLVSDVQAAWDGDPAAKSFDEIIFCYPGFYAVAIYRMAHLLHRAGAEILPRFMGEYAHGATGCDIHPGATIGERFFIDHATGVVIGETSLIGRNVRLYQGVTLGSLRFPRDAQGNLIRDQKRHPTLEDDVVVYANATILGGETVIGKGSVIGGNTWVTASVPPGSKIMLSPRGEQTAKS